MMVPEGMTYLESRSVKTPTLKDYQLRIDRFSVWCQQHRKDWKSASELDQVLALYLQSLFEAGRGQDEGIRVVAAIKFFIPEVSRLGERGLPRAVRSLKGWNLAMPQRQRLPMPLEVLGAMMGCLLYRGYPQLALRMFIQFVTYMRPGEISNLTVGQLIPPQPSMTNACQFWAILLHPQELKIPGKTALFDGSILLDSDLWMGPLLAKITVGRNPAEPLWADPHQLLVQQFSQITKELGLEELGLSLYALRHGGASHDILASRRPLLEVKKRGRWSTDSSLKRYVKEARLQHELSKVNPVVVQYGQGVLTDLPSLLMMEKFAKAPPSGIPK